MFLNILKYKALNKSIKQLLSQGQEVNFNGTIEAVGIILNQKDFSNKEAIVEELGLRGIKPQQISFLISKPGTTTRNEREVVVKSTDFDWNGQLKNDSVKQFINTRFDLLISYYEVDEILLLWCTAHSQARFKVGLSGVKINNNHFSLQLPIENYKTYIDELFRYIEIFKK